ncbi:hypothetical protein LA345_13200 [Burkholderia vietnamiensis]|nr:hypothetical protein [Burkholderia vietnamiensis]
MTTTSVWGKTEALLGAGIERAGFKSRTAGQTGAPRTLLAWALLPASVPYGIALGACGAMGACHPAPSMLVVLAAVFVAVALALTSALSQAGNTVAFLARKTRGAARFSEGFGWGAALSAATLGALALLGLVALLLAVFPLPMGGLLCLAIARRRRALTGRQLGPMAQA